MKTPSIVYETKPTWKHTKLNVTLSFIGQEIRFKMAEDSDYSLHIEELENWAINIFNNQSEDSRTLRVQLDNFSKKASFRAGSKKSKGIVLYANFI